MHSITDMALPRRFESDSDCDAAEEHVHAALERRGYREAKNREFFRAPASEVIKAILELSRLLPERYLLISPC